MATLYVVLAILQELCTSNEILSHSSFLLLHNSIFIYFLRRRACGRLLLSLQVEGNMLNVCRKLKVEWSSSLQCKARYRDLTCGRYCGTTLALNSLSKYSPQ